MGFVSDFWFGSDKEDIKYTTSSYSLIKMASFRRAVANFVTITTGKTIPVVYNAKDKSFTDGKVVVLSAQIPNAQIDAAVGLALHEATHIIREDWEWLENFDSHIPESVYNRALSKADLELTRKKVAKRIHGFWNWVRDRSNDAWFYEQAPGYRGYYTALYRKYFYRPIIDVALQSSKFRTPSWKGYNYRIINLHNKHRDLDALPGLREIWDIIDLKNINRIETSQDAFEVALKIWDIVIENLINPPKVKKPKTGKSTQAMTAAELDELDEETLKQLMEQTSPPESDDEDSESDGGQSIPLPDDTEWEQEPEEPTNDPEEENEEEDGTGETNDDESDDTENGENEEEEEDWENGDDLVDIGDEPEDDDETEDGETDDTGETNEKGQETDSNDTSNEDDTETTETEEDGSGAENTDDEAASDDTTDENDDEETTGVSGEDTTDENSSNGEESGEDEEPNGEESGVEDEELELEDLTEKEEELLEKAMKKQDDFLEKGVDKSELTNEQDATLKQMEKSGASVEKTGKEFGANGIKTVVIRKLHESMLEDLPIGNAHPITMSEEAVLEGIRLGRILGNKLQVRNETNVTVYTRKTTGKLDRRLIHAVGFSDAVCQQTFYDEYGDALIHISIDASSSMGSADKWKKTLATAVAIAKATETIDKLEVIISFRATTEIGDDGTVAPLVVIAYDSRFDKFIKIRKIFPRLAPNGWTPEGLAYEAIMKEILQSVIGKEGYFINFSDGQPYCPITNEDAWSGNGVRYSGTQACNHTKNQVRIMTDNGIKVLSFFIDSSYGSSESEFRIMYGKNSSFINVEQITSVAKVMNRKLLTK